MIVIVAEKHHMGQDIAEALAAPGSLRARESWFEGVLADGGEPFEVVYCDGHLLHLWEPEEYDPKWKKWSVDTLPIKPPDLKFSYHPRSRKAAALLAAIGSHCALATEIVNACDAGREGELIFWEAMGAASLPRKGQGITRLWIQDPTPEGIANAFRHRRPGGADDFRRLRDAGLLRQSADWIYGMNMSRFVTLRMPPNPIFPNATFRIGRVKTPVLGLIYDESEKARNFAEEPFYRIVIHMRGTADSFQANVIAPEDQRFGKVDTMFRDYTATELYAREIAIYANTWEAFDEVKEKREYAPAPFSLVDLQRAAFRLFRWPAAYTARVAQECYAVHKSITYPRTRSSALPDTMRASVHALHRKLWQEHILPHFSHVKDIPPQELSDWHFKASKDMEDHHAIIPTGRMHPRRGPDGKIPDSYVLWDLIVRRFALSMLAPAEINACSRVLTYTHPTKSELTFRALFTAAPVKAPGWLLVEEAIGSTGTEGKRLIDRLQAKFPPTPEVTECFRVQKIKGHTRRPPDFNDDTLMGVMEKLKLGTPATRAEIIEELIANQYIERRPNGDLVPRGLGAHLVQELRRMGAQELLSPDLTARWEKRFDELEKKDLQEEERRAFLDEAVERAEDVGRKLFAGHGAQAVVYCPSTHKQVSEDDFQYYFAGYPNIIFKKMFIGRQMSAKDWRDILVSNQKSGAGPFDGFNARGHTFSARVAYSPRRNKYGHFKLVRDKPNS